jgi:hypothetical protein
MVFVMYSQFAQPFSFKLAAAAPANRREQLERLFPIPLHAIVAIAPEFCHKFPITFRITRRHTALLSATDST